MSNEEVEAILTNPDDLEFVHGLAQLMENASLNNSLLSSLKQQVKEEIRSILGGDAETVPAPFQDEPETDSRGDIRVFSYQS